MESKIDRVIEIVKKYHFNHKRKYTGEPYFNHLVSVYDIVKEVNPTLILQCAALCHDLFEDTICDYPTLWNELQDVGLTKLQSDEICMLVTELTDQFTKEAYPGFNRKQRKILEANRLGKISDDAQTIKYADFIDNTKSILEHDPKFAKVYISEKEYVLQLMTLGNKVLFEKAKRQLTINPE